MKPSRRTITTRNRFITSTRNWWVNTTHLFSLSFVLLLAACADNPLEIGFKKEPRNFEVLYRELPLQSSMFLADSVFTFNNFTSGTSRLLVGTYSDPLFGKVSSSFYSQIAPSSTTRLAESGAIFDSVTLKLNLDFYHYGSRSVTKQRFDVYLLDKEIESTWYINRSLIPIRGVPIAQTSITISPDSFDKIVEDNLKDTVQISTVVNLGIGRTLFQEWVDHDTTFTKFELFKKEFFGIAVVPADGNDKIIGINPSSNLSKLVLHYHVENEKKDFDFYFNNVLGFNRIVSDRSNSPLAKLSTPGSDFVTPDGVAYHQSGVGVMTKFRMNNLIAFKDTLPNLSLNSVELEIPLNEYDAATPPLRHWHFDWWMMRTCLSPTPSLPIPNT